ncbi:uncharacterized protein LOC119829039 [Zerene cesonia]|uniref:uncharacterized protein LOC119829039 n=1 Tax=Zerene cesonia TaxID=33412 RepID=UPI0018E571FE|nr:uncharacterized protein LOC119829039 [Zerene cesonia]
MCEKRTRKFKKGSNITRLREARRLQRLQWLATPIIHEEVSPPIVTQSTPEKVAQNRLILDLAWKTLALMHKNRLIQEKIVALQRETSEFVSAIMSNPENKKRYLEYVRLYNAGQLPDLKKELEAKTRVKTKPE